ncbi:MAG: endopeptidase La [Elusimicrobia bacterium]|nr:endopeptidase La [Elusimicrobiota bacterium]
MPLPLRVGRGRSIRALEKALKAGKLVAVVSQKDSSDEDPKEGDLYKVGVVAEIVQSMKMPEGTLSVFLQGLRRVKFTSLKLAEGDYWEVELEPMAEPWKASPKIEALMRQCVQLYDQWLRITKRVPPEAAAAAAQTQDPGRLADTIAHTAVSKLSDRQALLETPAPLERLEKLVVLLNSEIEVLTLERKIHTRVKTQIQKTQKEYYLTEQMKAIQKELRQKDDFAKELDEIRAKVAEAKMPPTARDAALKELSRLEKMMPFSPESTVCRSYLDWMTALPWAKRTKDKLDVPRARKILDKDHYGLPKAKDRILEYLAVCKLTKKLRGPILCFVGPPGVGKTSLGRSIAEAMNRSFVRLSLGGVRDEAEVRGHRRTYIGSLPGRIIQSMRKAGSRNPVFLLDEIDKMGMDWRGDPAAALLEVLDPEQNSTFVDHYIDTEFDLSSVLFICTANTLEGIPVPLQDRLEIIRFSGYTHKEKIAIARGHLIPKQVGLHGLKPAHLELSDDALLRLIQEYTREAGVRSLERELSALCRKAAREVVEHHVKKFGLKQGDIPRWLGIPKYPPEDRFVNGVGVATGLTWTEVGGTTLPIEVLAYPGKGEIQLTGKLGSVMQESAKAALSFVKSQARELGIPATVVRSLSFHIHVPEGAVPKDGPSAGIALATALASRLSGRAVVPGLAMTGEITLLGRVLPIGGLKEKVMAAQRLGLRTVLFPEANRKDLEEIPKEVRAALELVGVSHIGEVLARALEPASRGVRARAGAWKGLGSKDKAGAGYAAPQA